MTELSLLSNQLKIQIRHLYLTGHLNLSHKRRASPLLLYRMRIITVYFSLSQNTHTKKERHSNQQY